MLRTDVASKLPTAATSATGIARFMRMRIISLFQTKAADFRRMDSSEVTESIQETVNSSEKIS